MSGTSPRKKSIGGPPEKPGAGPIKTTLTKRAKPSGLALLAAPRKKPFVYKSGTIVRRALKKDTGLVLEKSGFRLTAREITGEMGSECKWQASALELLQEMADKDLVRHLEMAQIAAHHDKRLVITMKDMVLAKVMRGLFAAQRELFSNWKA